MGTVFKFGSGGFTSSIAFSGSDGAYPFAPPIQAPDGNIYGMTSDGDNPGTIYRITPSGVYSAIATAPSETIAPFDPGFGWQSLRDDAKRGRVQPRHSVPTDDHGESAKAEHHPQLQDGRD